MARKFSAVVLSLGCLNAGSVLALGLGDLKLESYLNEPLRAQMNLLNTGTLHEDQIRIRLATRDDFDKMGIERAYFLTSIRFEVQLDDNGNGRVILTSEDPVLEPYLDFIVEARWPSGRLLREYTVLVDPPVFDESAQVISATARVVEVEGEAMPATAPGKKKSETAVERTGTHVDVRQSDLPPGQMPQRDFSADTAAVPTPGARYLIRRDDTLWEIARDARPEGTSVHQTMLDIQRLNPDAFLDGNINRIKAGYIIYLPSAGDISSGDQAAAIAQVRQQNEDWRAGRGSEAYATGPTLRITADTEAAAEGEAVAGAGGEGQPGGGGVVAAEDLEKVELERAELEERLGAMEQQVQTLERIVSLKDEQIAALQNALDESGGEEVLAATGAGDLAAPEASPASAAGEAEAAAGEDTGAGMVGDAGEMTAEAPEEPAEEAATAAAVAAAPKAADKPAPAPARSPADSGGALGYLWYGLGALVVAILGFLLLRRRGSEAEEAGAVEARVDSGDVFAGVELKDENLEVAAVEPAAETVEQEIEPEPEPQRDSRGYGERKHDEYASDVDTGDALAEADIYVAYGRYPQAVDLLKNASAGDPDNPAFKLKLLEIYAEMDDRDGVLEQLAALEKIGDGQALARAEEVLAVMQGKAAAGEIPAAREMTPPAPPEPAPHFEPAAAPAEEEALSLQSDFGELEIEEPAARDVADDLDLSRDFAAERVAAGREEDEDLVIAAESNGMSTKLDLARAYLDMGDEDGARQILEEVVAEGSGDVQAEARALLDRIG